MRQETHDGTRPGKQNASDFRPNPARSQKTSTPCGTLSKTKDRDIRPNEGTEKKKGMDIFVRSFVTFFIIMFTLLFTFEGIYLFGIPSPYGFVQSKGVY